MPSNNKRQSMAARASNGQAATPSTPEAQAPETEVRSQSRRPGEGRVLFRLILET